MRKARYDMKQVICPKSSLLGYSSNVAKPGYWIQYDNGSGPTLARVLGRIAETPYDGLENCAGYLAVIRLSCEATHAGINWIAPEEVTHCYETSPAKLLAWLTGDDWVKSKHDIARIIAMSEHGTLSEAYIENRDKPDQAYNARPEYIAQFILP